MLAQCSTRPDAPATVPEEAADPTSPVKPGAAERDRRAPTDDEPGAFGEDEEEIPQESLGRALASKSGIEEYNAANDPMPQRPGMKKLRL